MALLKIKNLTIGFNGENYSYNVVKDISFELNKGEVLGIVGESGSGKSLTALSILGLLPYPKAFHTKNSSIKFDNVELLDNPNWGDIRGKRIGFVFQEPLSSLNPLHRVGDQVAEALLQHQKISKKKAYTETLKLFKQVEIQNPVAKMKSYPFELSGGQRQRVMIAMAIANKPDILILDEPTTALDVTVAAQILKLLRNLQKKLNIAVIFISHDLNVIKQISNRVLVMKSGRIVEQGKVEDIFYAPQQKYTKSLMYSSNILKKNNNIFKDFVLEAKHLTVKFALEKSFWGKTRSYLYAVNNVSFKLKKGKTLGVVGEYGCGNTTIAMALIKLVNYSGNVEINRSDIANMSAKALAKKIQIVFQDPFNSLNPRMRAFDIVAEGIRIHWPQITSSEVLARVQKVWCEVGLKPDGLDKYPHEFSGGQRQRIAIARALAVEPDILILDEPTTALDVTIAAQIIKLLQQIQAERELSYLFISHDMRSIRALADDIAVMKDGRIVELNNAYQLMKFPKHAYTKYLMSAANIYGSRYEHKERPTTN